MTPRVSIVMATRNYARFLPEAIESVRAQTMSDWELIIIDDGSTDDTRQVLAASRNDERIRIIASDRLGQSRAKNLGIGLSRAPRIAFLDADDVWLPEKLEKQLPLFTDAVGVVYSLRTLIDESGNALPQRTPVMPPSGRVADAMFVQNFVCFSSVVVRRSLFEQVGRFDESLDLAIDYDLWLRAARHCEFAFVPEPLVRYRTGHGNLSRKLADRVATAESIMTRAVRRGGFAATSVAEGFASTCRTMAYVLRGAEPVTSLRWSCKALPWPHRRAETLKGIAGTLLRWLRGIRTPTAAENLSVNR